MSWVAKKTVSTDDADIRLDRWFKRHYPDLSFIQLQKLLRKGSVRIDGKRAKAGQRLEAGQEIRVPPMHKVDKKRPKSQGSEEDLLFLQDLILHMDEQVIALNKPPGLAVQGGTNTLRHIDGMLDALKFGKDERPRLVHRLDKDTSGVLLIARSAAAASKLAKAFESRDAHKVYWALVMGVPQMREGTIKAPLAKLPGLAGERMEVDEVRGDMAITDYRVIEALQHKVSWLELEPRTGRTHQLRVHCMVLGTPIVGDGKYGGKEAFLTGAVSRKMHLHARSISLPHPAGGTLEVTAPLPKHMEETFQFLGFSV